LHRAATDFTDVTFTHAHTHTHTHTRTHARTHTHTHTGELRVQRVKSGQGVVVDAHIFVQKLATTDIEDVSVADDGSRTHRLAVEKRWVDLAHLHGNHLPR
jgi:ABC-type Fe3+-citrate transport system substrate-binding protein